MKPVAPVALLFVPVLVAVAASAAQLPEVASIEGDPVATVLPPDAIPAIDEPDLVPAKRARFMQDAEPVLGVIHEGQARAYSLWHLDRHEIVNDRLGDTPIAATW